VESVCLRGGDPINKSDPSGLDPEDGLGLEGFYDLWRRRESFYDNEPSPQKPRWDPNNCWFSEFDQLSKVQQDLLGSKENYGALNSRQKASFLNITFVFERLGIDLSGQTLLGGTQGILSDRLQFEPGEAVNNLLSVLSAQSAADIFTSAKPSEREHPRMADWGFRQAGTRFSLQVGGGPGGVFADIDLFNPTDGLLGLGGHVLGEFVPNKIRRATTNPFRVGKELFDRDQGEFKYNCYR
jgi:hypothetical protein